MNVKSVKRAIYDITIPEPIRNSNFYVTLPSNIKILEENIVGFGVDRANERIVLKFGAIEGSKAMETLIKDLTFDGCKCTLHVIKSNGEEDYRDVFHNIEFKEMIQDQFNYKDTNLHTILIIFKYDYERIEYDTTN